MNIVALFMWKHPSIQYSNRWPGCDRRGFILSASEVQKKEENKSGGYDCIIIQFMDIDNIKKARITTPKFFTSEYDHVKYQRAIIQMAKMYDERFG